MLFAISIVLKVFGKFKLRAYRTFEVVIVLITKRTKVYDRLIKSFFHKICERTSFYPTFNNLQCSKNSGADSFLRLFPSLFFVWLENFQLMQVKKHQFFQKTSGQSAAAYFAAAFSKNNPSNY